MCHITLDSIKKNTIILSVARGVEQLVARRAHNPKVAGSNPAPATTHGGKMSLLQEIDNRFVHARRNRNKEVADCLRMIKSRISILQTSKGFSGELTDDAVHNLIISYVKELRKSLAEIEKGGAGKSEIALKYRFELDYLDEFMPTLMDIEQTKELVMALITEIGATTKKDKGKIMSMLMKKYRGQVDPKLGSQICDQLLS